MAKSKNHTAHNQSYKAHKNGIKKPRKQRHTSTKGKRKHCDQTLPFRGGVEREGGRCRQREREIAEREGGRCRQRDCRDRGRSLQTERDCREGGRSLQTERDCREGGRSFQTEIAETEGGRCRWREIEERESERLQRGREPNTVTPMVSSLSHLSLHGAPQGAQASSPSPTSQEMVTNGDSVQGFKPFANGMAPPLRPSGPPAANVSILNNLSQARQVISSASLTAANSMGLQTMVATPMAMHMSNMISSGMASSALPAAQTVFSSGPAGITSIAGSGALVGTGQVTQNTAHGSFTSASSNMSGNSNIGISPILSNLPGAIGMGQSVPVMAQGNLTSGTQIGQGGIGMNQNIMNGLGQLNISSGAGTMIPTPGMSQQVQAGLQSLVANNGSAANMTLPQHPSGTLQSQSKYLKVWEGALSGQRQGQAVFICRLEGYRNATASETLAADWPPTMQIVRLISQDHMNNKQYVGKADFLVFRALNQHGFLGQLQEKKLCAVIQLPSQTLLLSVSYKASRLIGMLFPGDMVVFKRQMSSQQQQQQQQLQQQQQQLQQQLQQLQRQQSQQQQMVGAGMSQTFVQGPGRPQMMSQGQVSSQGPPNMTGGGFLS